MSVSTGNSKSKAIKQACLVCFRISKETSAAGVEWVTEEMTRSEGREVARGLDCIGFKNYVMDLGFFL